MTFPLRDPLYDQLQLTLHGSYVLERELGGGGMSRVFLAEEVRLRRKVVVKVLSPDLAQGISLERFEREVQTVAALSQANIVPVHAAGDTNGLPYYTMPFVEGESLRARIGHGPMTVSDVVAVLRDVTRALAYAHQRGVVHRDIKPDNILMSGDAAVVTDFGIAKAISVSRTLAGVETLTQVGMSVGTPAYMAPEQAAGDSGIDHRADLYALGALAYEMLTGQVLFPGRTAQRMLAGHLSEAPTPVRDLRKDMPLGLALLVMRCLAKDPNERPQQASDIARELDAIASQDEYSATPTVVAAGPTPLWKALALYSATTVAVVSIAKAAIVAIGLPDWVLPASIVVTALGLPVLLWTAYVQHVAQQSRVPTVNRTPGGSVAYARTGTVATLALRAIPRTSWRQTRRGGMYALGTFVTAVAAFMGARVAGIGPGATLFSTGALGRRDRLVLTDFGKTDGDSLARAVAFGVRRVLEQSDVINVVSQNTVATTLALMALPANARVDLARARQIAARAGAKAVVDGELTPVGNGFVLTLTLLSADSGRVLATFQEAGDGPQGLVDIAGKAGRALRAKAGESLRSVQNAVPLWKATTPSIEALGYLSDGVYQHLVTRNRRAAIAFFQKAVAIDSGCAECWRRLGVVMGDEPNYSRAQADSALATAFRFRDHTSPAERDNVIATYYQYGPGRDREKAVEHLEIGARRQDVTAMGNLAIALRTLRQSARAESLYRAVLAIDSTIDLVHYNLITILINQGKLDDAARANAIYRRRFPSSPRPGYFPLRLALLRGHLDEYEQGVDSALRANTPGDRGYWMLRAEELALLRGRPERFRELRRARVVNVPVATLTPAALAESAQVLQVAALFLGDSAAAWKRFDLMLMNTPLHTMPDAERPDLQIAARMAFSGRPERARAVLAAYDATMRDTAIKRSDEWQVHNARGVIAFAERRFADARTEFQRGDMLADGPSYDCEICLSLYLGLVSEAANEPDSAIMHFERYIATPYSGRTFLTLDPMWLAPLHERLGRLYESRNNSTKAMEHYRAFIELWKNADPELQPRVTEARQHVVRLLASMKKLE